MESWTDDLTSLFLLRDSLEGVVSADDITVLQERLQLLQRQWEEVCHQVRSHCSHDQDLSFFYQTDVILLLSKYSLIKRSVNIDIKRDL